ncbi:glycosyl hydrolase family 28-related protein [Solitalea koreensis]|uniref:Pectate lyase superfamily protein n=1 Tax=Solitalea koreensis TaxID=543615 RepID=A0A521BPA1_9SPHI|nr:glycosyl hydrolase family 28-related protein [Solitalea koreensis]SMO48992.1 Pectate lyase superfamily protein [Solitalea koreensis]
MKLNRIVILFFLFFVKSFSYAQVHSQLWGRKGEKWDKTKIPDFTKAGYKSGNAGIPNFPTGVNVCDFGAVGDGVSDNTNAFRKAIASCGRNKAVFIPAGVYLLKDTIQFSKSNICLRGDKTHPPTIYFEKGLEQLYPHYNQEWPKQSDWSWEGGMIRFEGNIENVGIQNCNIKFPDSAWAGHNFHERGYNGIAFGRNVHNAWMRSVRLTNTDIGVWVERSAHHITIENLVLDFGANRNAQKLQGHHGITIYGGYNLIQNFQIKGKYSHDLSVESSLSVFNVFRNGKATDLCIDHHNHDQRNNLFTNLDAGIGSRLYLSGGNEGPWGLSVNETYWNITAQRNMPYCNVHDDASKQSVNNVAVGIKTNLPSSLNDVHNNWFETISPTDLYPKDLYLEQRKRLKLKRY